MNPIYAKWTERWKAAVEAIPAHGGTVHAFEQLAPATEEQLAAIEARLERKIPQSMRDVLTEFSAAVAFEWNVYEEGDDEDFDPDNVFCLWNMYRLPACEENRKLILESIEGLQFEPGEMYFDTAFSFIQVINGDQIAIDTAQEGEPVIYLSHDLGGGHGGRLAANFADFIDRWSKIACMPFDGYMLDELWSEEADGLDPHSEFARMITGRFALEFD